MRFRKALTLLLLAMGLVFALSAWAQQKPVAPGFSPARAALKGGSTTPTSTPAKPFTQDQVQGLVRDGLGDESGVKLIEQRGIDFAPVGMTPFPGNLSSRAQRGISPCGFDWAPLPERDSSSLALLRMTALRAPG